MKNVMKKVLSITTAACMLAGLFAVSVSAETVGGQGAALQPGESLAQNPVYLMDFSPDADGKFYDSPAGTEGRQVVPMTANPDGIKSTNRDENVNNQIISNAGNTSKLVPSGADAGSYAAFSTRGASGAAADYSLKVAHSFNVTAYNAKITLPKAYGGEEDSCKKYRFEADWQYAYYTSSGLTDYTLQDAMPIMGFYIDDKLIKLQAKAANRASECRGDYALFVYDGDNSSSSTFGFTPSASDTAEADLDKVTMSAESLPADRSGKWIHVTVDIDFSAGTIYVTFKSDTVTREISTKVAKNSDIFKKGVNKLYFCGAKKSVAILNFFDNIKITPIMTEAPTLQKDGTKLKWNAIEGATSYNVYFGNSESAAAASTTPVENLTFDETTEPGYVTVDLGALGANVPSYYTVTAVSDNKGESVKSNVVDMMNRQNVVSDIAVAGGKATVSINAGEGFANPLYLIAAEYNGSELTNVEMSEPATFSQGTAENMEVSFASTANINNMKFFLWDSNLIPVKMWEGANLGN